MAGAHFSSNGAQLLAPSRQHRRKQPCGGNIVSGTRIGSMCCMSFALCVHSYILPCLMALIPPLSAGGGQI